MGKLGVPVWCYEWMTDFNWLRTNMATPSRGGSVVTSFNAADVPATPTENGPISEEALWDNLEYFLDHVLPVAESAGVKLAMHPDDPPLSPIRGVGRIMRSVENFRRLVDMRKPSPVNGVTLCQGNFTLMTNDLPSGDPRFRDKIFFVHFRDVRGVPERFEETWHDAGQTDMLACMRAYRDIGFNGVLRPDHVPTVEGDSNEHAGYSAFGRLYAIGYIRGLRQAVYARDREIFMKIALTGGSGRIGRAIVVEALAQGHRVVNYRPQAPPAASDAPDARSCASTSRDYDALVAAFRGCDALVHMAAIPRRPAISTMSSTTTMSWAATTRCARPSRSA